MTATSTQPANTSAPINASARPLRSNTALGSKLMRGSALFFLSTTLVNVGNYAFNLILGRWLGPAAFADLSLVVTLLLLLSFVGTSFSMVTAKFVAAAVASGDWARVAALRAWLMRLAWVGGFVLMALLAGGAPVFQRFFNTASWLPFAFLGLGMPLFLTQTVNRGLLQGQTRFGLLALNYQVEMWTRLLAAIVFVALGFGVNGAAASLPLSFAALWVVGRLAGKGLPASFEALSAEDRRTMAQFALAASTALIGQILINNSDVLIVRHFFDAEPAGHYAALALIGRIVFFATWSVVTTMFPIVAQKHQKGESHHHLLMSSLGMVGVVSIVILAATYFAPQIIVRVLFGEAYLAISPLLWLYAASTALYAMASVVVNYRLSAGNKLGSIFVVVAGLAQVMGLWFMHNSLSQVVWVQIVIMVALLLLTLVWDVVLQRRLRGQPA